MGCVVLVGCVILVVVILMGCKWVLMECEWVFMSVILMGCVVSIDCV